MWPCHHKPLLTSYFGDLASGKLIQPWLILLSIHTSAILHLQKRFQAHWFWLSMFFLFYSLDLRGQRERIILIQPAMISKLGQRHITKCSYFVIKYLENIFLLGQVIKLKHKEFRGEIRNYSLCFKEVYLVNRRKSNSFLYL